jgi:hypothetical protein
MMHDGRDGSGTISFRPIRPGGSSGARQNRLPVLPNLDVIWRAGFETGATEHCMLLTNRRRGSSLMSLSMLFK